MKNHVKKSSTIFGFNPYFKPGRAGSFIPGLSILKLKNNPYTFESNKNEVFILILSGALEISIEGHSTPFSFKRESVFHDLPSGLYIPPFHKVIIQPLKDPTEAAFCFSSELYLGKKEDKNLQPCRCASSDVIIDHVGEEGYRRKVLTLCGTRDETYSLLVGETLSHGGMWSSYPPHKHEKNEMPKENKLKEIYYYRIDPPQGFAFQGIYSNVSRSESAFLVRDGDAVYIPNGYHPVSAAPGYNLYYLWILSGQTPARAWKVDEKHEWLEKK